MQLHRRQPTRLPRPWDFPGKNTGVGCHCLLQCMKVKSESEVAQSCLTLSDPMDCSLPGSSVHGIFQARVLEWGAIAFSEHLLVLQFLFLLSEIIILCSCCQHLKTTAFHSVYSCLWWEGKFDPSCSFILAGTVYCVDVLSCSVVSSSLPSRLLCPWDSPGKNTRVGCHALLQGIFPTQG